MTTLERMRAKLEQMVRNPDSGPYDNGEPRQDHNEIVNRELRRIFGWDGYCGHDDGRVVVAAAIRRAVVRREVDEEPKP